MANLAFSWSDGVRAAVSSCLPCFASPHSQRPQNVLVRARPDELEGLLADSDSADPETLSLHSTFGDDRRRRNRPRPRKGIRLFGWDLFGRPPIYLDSDDDDDAPHSHNVSSSTLDSDAAPLDAATIEQLSAARLAAATAAAEEEQRLAKEERRRLRRERKELARAARAMGLAADDEFEGVPGGGPVSARAFASPGSGSMSPSADEFGPFHTHDDADADADADGADFGAETYARRTPRGASSGTGSDSHSRTSDPVAYTHRYLSLPAPLALPAPPRAKKRKSTHGHSQSSKQSESSHEPSLRTSQSPSLPSPRADSVVFSEPGIAAADDGFEGFPGGVLESPRAEHKLGAKVDEASAEGGFPSVGLRALQRRKSDMGVFLARRGDE